MRVEKMRTLAEQVGPQVIAVLVHYLHEPYVEVAEYGVWPAWRAGGITVVLGKHESWEPQREMLSLYGCQVLSSFANTHGRFGYLLRKRTGCGVLPIDSEQLEVSSVKQKISVTVYQKPEALDVIGQISDLTKKWFVGQREAMQLGEHLQLLAHLDGYYSEAVDERTYGLEEVACLGFIKE